MVVQQPGGGGGGGGDGSGGGSDDVDAPIGVDPGVGTDPGTGDDVDPVAGGPSEDPGPSQPDGGDGAVDAPVGVEPGAGTSPGTSDGVTGTAGGQAGTTSPTQQPTPQDLPRGLTEYERPQGAEYAPGQAGIPEPVDPAASPPDEVGAVDLGGSSWLEEQVAQQGGWDASQIDVQRAGEGRYTVVRDTDSGTYTRTIDLDLEGQLAESAGVSREDVNVRNVGGGDDWMFYTDASDLYADEASEYADEAGISVSDVLVTESQGVTPEAGVQPSDGNRSEATVGAGIGFAPTVDVQREQVREQLDEGRQQAAEELGVSPSEVQVVEGDSGVSFAPTQEAQADLIQEQVAAEEGVSEGEVSVTMTGDGYAVNVDEERDTAAGRWLEDQSDTITSAGSDLAGAVGDVIPDADVTGWAVTPSLSQFPDSGVTFSDVGRETVEAGTALVNVPGHTLAAGDFIVDYGRSTGSLGPAGGPVVQDPSVEGAPGPTAVESAGEVYDFARENPAEFTAQAIGAGIVGLASAPLTSGALSAGGRLRNANFNAATSPRDRGMVGGGGGRGTLEPTTSRQPGSVSTVEIDTDVTSPDFDPRPGPGQRRPGRLSDQGPTRLRAGGPRSPTAGGVSRGFADQPARAGIGVDVTPTQTAGGAITRMQAAAAPSWLVASQTLTGETTQPTVEDSEELLGQSVDQRTQQDVTQPELIGAATETSVAQDTDVGQLSDVDGAQTTATLTGTGQDTGTGTGQSERTTPTTDTPMVPDATTTRTTPRTPPPSLGDPDPPRRGRRRTRTPDDDDGPGGLSVPDFGFGATLGVPETRDRGPTFGWLSEGVTDIGTLGMEAPTSPGESRLQDLSGGMAVASDLPTSQLLGDDEDVEAAAGAFEFGTFELGTGNGDDDGELSVGLGDLNV